MSPDSALGALAQRVAKLEQRADDLMQRVLDKFADFAEDLRVFAPLVNEHADMRAELRFLRENVTALLAQSAVLEKRFEEEREERIRGQRERKEELEVAREERNAEIARIEEARAKRDKEIQDRADQQKLENRRLLYGLLAVFLSSLSAVLVPLLTGGHP